MTKRMLIDATHAEETRVVVLDGSRLEDFDVETAAKKQLKGNIYLAKVVRVEPSLQAAFVEYGGGRHGFLAFGEIHPDYYQIPVADRQRLMELQEAEARAEEEADDAAAAADEAAERGGSLAPEESPARGESLAQDESMGLDDRPALDESVVLDDSAAIGDLAAEEPTPGLAADLGVLGEPEPAGMDDAEAAIPVDTAQLLPAGPALLDRDDAVMASEVAPLGLGDGTSIPGHAEPEHVLSEPVDPPYGAQDEIAAAIDAAPPAGSEAAAPASEQAEVPHTAELHAEAAHSAQPDPEQHPAGQPGADGAEPLPTPETDSLGLAAPVSEEPEVPHIAQLHAGQPDTGQPGADGPEPPLRAQPAAMAQDIVSGDDSFAAGLGADFSLEGTEPASLDPEFAPSPEPGSDRERRGDEIQGDETRGYEPQRDDTQGEEPREDDPRESRAPARFMRSYKIQEVIRRRQILLIQVVKEERGSKGAALTTYISLAGRFSVLMPNSPRGGGISRKITSTADRRRLKEVTSELQIPRGMGLIVRTAGANRPKAEIKRDCEYLLELWDSIRETTMKSIAPALIHEEANLIKRAIRDNYSRDVDEVLVDGEAGWRAARDFMRMLMPAHARKVALWNDPQPLFAKYAVEAQLDAMLVPTVQLRSGGYLVINQTEALVAVDVNSGRSTRERGIEETAVKTNLEAADEVARQLRLRDLAGLIVIDFIDMESRRNNAAVEKRMKDALKDDRARIQLGSISSFGLMEMSRQRLRPSLAETSFAPCPHCGGTGHVRSTETSALAVLRAIEDEGAKRRAAEICVYVAGAIALYVLNHKRVRLAEIEARYGMSVSFAADESLLPPQTRIEKLRAQVPSDMLEPPPTVIPISQTRPIDAEDDLAEEEDDEADEPEAAVSDPVPAVAALNGAAPVAETAADGETRKRRRRRRGGRREDGVTEPGAPVAAPEETIDLALADQPDLPLPPLPVGEAEDAGLSAAAAEEARGRRRGRRGGRRRRRDEPGGEANPAMDLAEDGASEEAPASFDAPPRPAYTGPTPADPFGGGVFDIYDVMEQAEARAAAPPPPSPPPIETPKRPEIEAAAAEATVPMDAELAPAPEPLPEPEAPAIVQAVPMEYAAEETLPEPEIVPAPVGDAIVQTVPLEYAAQETLPEPAPRPEPVAGPISAPVIIGTDEAGEAKKRGWWRR